MSHQSDLIASDIEAYLKVHENKDMLRILTCGSVDDGKSTLIGRLLYDSKMIFDDQMAAIRQDSQRFNTTDQEFDLALLVDGLQAEREQGITIDVAYRYFSTEKRKFIIADTPGHEQYTRNMATGASNCELAVILIDARHGVQVQTRRHSFICSLLGIKQVVVAINKMDLVGYDQARYNEIVREYRAFAEQLKFGDIHCIPLSALKGDNVVEASAEMPWYDGAPLLKLLDGIEIDSSRNLTDFRLPVQYVNRPNLDFRGFCGTISSGIVKVGDEVSVLPSGQTSRVKRIVTFDGDLPQAACGMAVTLVLADEIDISRGDVLVHRQYSCAVTDKVEAHLVWMSETPMIAHQQYEFKLATKRTTGSIQGIQYLLDVNTMAQKEAVRLQLNEIARCEIQFSQTAVVDPYDVARGTGAFIIIDRLTNATLGAGMVIAAGDAAREHMDAQFSAFELELNALIRKHFPHWDARDLGELLKR